MNSYSIYSYRNICCSIERDFGWWSFWKIALSMSSSASYTCTIDSRSQEFWVRQKILIQRHMYAHDAYIRRSKSHFFCICFMNGNFIRLAYNIHACNSFCLLTRTASRLWVKIENSLCTLSLCHRSRLNVSERVIILSAVLCCLWCDDHDGSSSNGNNNSQPIQKMW